MQLCFSYNPRLLSIITGVFTLLFAMSLHAGSKGLEPEDYFQFVNVLSPAMSPDGQKILFVKQTINENADGRERQIFLVTEEGDVRAFSQGKNDNSPKWSPDGKTVSFTRKVDDGIQLFVMPVDGGEAKQLTKLDEAIVDYAWFPNGKKLLLTLAVLSEEVQTPSTIDDKAEAQQEPTKQDLNEAAKDEQSRKAADVTVVTNAKYIRNGSGFLKASRNHLFIYDIASAELKQLTFGANWNAKAAQVSPNGNSVLYYANAAGDEYEGGENDDVFSLDIDTLKVTNLTNESSSQWQPAPSSSKNKLVYLHKADTYAQTELFLLDNKGNKTELTGAFDRDIASPMWIGDSNEVLFLANDHGANRLFKLELATKEVHRLLREKQTIRHLNVSSDGRFAVFTLESSIALPELYKLTLESGKLSQLTQFNQPLIQARTLSKAEDVWFTNDKDMRVHGFLHKPLGFDSSAKYPLILNIKGGPGGMWGHQWFHENQMFAAKGYAVVYVNYRGSSGYGIEHSQAVRLDYGGADYRDNMQFLEHVLANNDWIDEDKLYVTGGSHGGFLTNWITTKTNRFKAAVTQRSVSSWISEAGTQEYTPSQMTKEFGGTLWQNFDYYWGRSPLKYADKVTTPTLIIHSDEDMVTPIGQGQEWFYALKANGVDTEMVVFHGENHSLSRSGKPTNLVERIERIIDWFERY